MDVECWLLIKCASEGTCLVGEFARMLYVKRCEEDFSGRVGDKLKL